MRGRKNLFISEPGSRVSQMIGGMEKEFRLYLSEASWWIVSRVGGDVMSNR